MYSYDKYNSDSLLNTHSTVEDCRNLAKMQLNGPGRQKLGRYMPCKLYVKKELGLKLPYAALTRSLGANQSAVQG